MDEIRYSGGKWPNLSRAMLKYIIKVKNILVWELTHELSIGS